MKKEKTITLTYVATDLTEYTILKMLKTYCDRKSILSGWVNTEEEETQPRFKLHIFGLTVRQSEVVTKQFKKIKKEII